MIDWMEISRHFSAHELLRDQVPPIKHLQLWPLFSFSFWSLYRIYTLCKGALQLTCFHSELQEEGAGIAEWTRAGCHCHSCPRNMWSGMQAVAVRGILTGGGGRLPESERGAYRAIPPRKQPEILLLHAPSCDDKV